MITWYIIGIIMFVFQVYILKHTHFVEVSGLYWDDSFEEQLEPIKVPRIIVILMLLLTAIPYAWVISTAVFWVFWWHRYLNPESKCYGNTYIYWRLRDNFLMKSI